MQERRESEGASSCFLPSSVTTLIDLNVYFAISQLCIHQGHEIISGNAWNFTSMFSATFPNWLQVRFTSSTYLLLLPYNKSLTMSGFSNAGEPLNNDVLKQTSTQIANKSFNALIFLSCSCSVIWVTWSMTRSWHFSSHQGLTFDNVTNRTEALSYLVLDFGLNYYILGRKTPS